MTGTAAVLVSVIVPNFNGGSMLRRCVESLSDTAASCPIELIVVDNGSNDGSVELIQPLPLPVRVVQNDKNLGYATACNQGAEIAGGQYLLLLNNDVVLRPQSIARLVAAADADVAGGLWQPVMLRADGRSLDSAGSWFTRTGFLSHERTVPSPHAPPRSIFAAKGACLLVRRHVFRELGGFDPAFFAYFEDSDLSWRARMAGWEVRLVPAVQVLHEMGGTAARIFSQHEIDFFSYRNRVVTLLANMSVPKLLTVFAFHVVCCLGMALIAIVTRRLASAVSILRAIAWPFANWSYVQKRRRLAQSVRIVRDRSVFRRELTARVSFKWIIPLVRGYVRGAPQ